MKTLIFDFDGTIADSFETLLAIFEEITNRKSKLTPKEISELRGKSLKGIISYLKIRRWQIPKLLIKARTRVESKISTIQTFDGMSETLRDLNSQGCQMFILSTNSSKNINQFLKNNNLDMYFAKIYGDIGLRRKSSVIKRIMRKEKIAAKNCFYIGDETRDIEAAKKAGVISVAVGWGFNFPRALRQAGPDFLIKHPNDLVKLLGNKNARQP